MAVTNMNEAKTNTERVSGSMEIPIVKAGEQLQRPKRKPGAWKGKVWMSPDFDKPDAELEALFYEGLIEPAS